jgi:hypothetical protein
MALGYMVNDKPYKWHLTKSKEIKQASTKYLISHRYFFNHQARDVPAVTTVP